MASNTNLENQIAEIMTNTDSMVLDLSELIYLLTSNYSCFIPVSEGLYYKGTNDLLISNTHPDYNGVKNIIDNMVPPDHMALGDPRPRHIWLSDGGCITIAPFFDPKSRFTTTPQTNLLVLAVIRLFVSQSILEGINYHYGHFTDIAKEKALLSQFGLYEVIEYYLNYGDVNISEAINRLQHHKGDMQYADFGMMTIKDLPESAYIGFVKLMLDNNLEVIVKDYMTDLFNFVAKKPWSLYDVTYHGEQVLIHRMGDYRALEWVLHQIDQRDEELKALKESGALVNYQTLKTISADTTYQSSLPTEVITPSNKVLTVEDIRSYVEVKEGVHYYL